MKTLQKVVHHNFLVGSLISIFVIELMLLILYFGINHYTSSEYRKALLDQVVSSLEQITDREAEIINQQLNTVAQSTRLVLADHERFFAEFESCNKIAEPPKYKRHVNGTLYKPVDDGGATFYYGASAPDTLLTRRKAACSESLDPLLRSVVNTSDVVTQAYVNTFDDMNRLYPFVPNVSEVYPVDSHMMDFNFYYLADANHNPSRGLVWTSAYLDPAGQGWMISNIAPVYTEDFLEGVVGLDITIERFIHQVLNLKLPWQASAFLMDETGTVLAMQHSAGELLGLEELTAHHYEGAIGGTVEKPEDFNILDRAGDNISIALAEVISGDSGVVEAKIAGTSLMVGASVIQQTGWRLVTLARKGIILSPVDRLHNLSITIGWIAILLMLMFYAVFFIVLKRRSLALSKRIAAPIETLSEQTRNVVDFEVPDKIRDTGIMEIDTLTHNFVSMASELERRTEALIESRVEKQVIRKEKDVFRALANTDQLTGLANRLRLNEVFEHEFKLCKRYDHAMGVILLDVDHFKLVNDTFGHDRGDSVLQEIASLIRDTVRETDMPGRWGGEEFLIICHEGSVDGLQVLAEKIRAKVAEHQFLGVGCVTVSLGVAQLLDQETKPALLKRADRALYQAKGAGRNTWVLAQEYSD